MIFKKDEADEADEDMASAAPHVARAGERPGDRKERQMSDNGEVTVVGVGARLDGNLVSAGSLRIDGQVKGQINADGDVTLAPQSQVEADIRAQNVSVAGRFKGNIAVKGKAHLARGGRVDGNITSKTLVVEEGGIFHGQSIMDGAAPGSSAGQTGAQAGSQAHAANPADKSTTEKTEQVKVP
ncbi:MAG: polymer-forming cytoskeletal protein [Actinomycetota bacterium]